MAETRVESNYPTLIIEDRYSGLYAGGKWIAVGAYYQPCGCGCAHDTRLACVEEGARGGDIEAMNFWFKTEERPWLAVGDTPDHACQELEAQLDRLNASLIASKAMTHAREALTFPDVIRTGALSVVEAELKADILEALTAARSAAHPLEDRHG